MAEGIVKNTFCLPEEIADDLIDITHLLRRDLKKHINKSTIVEFALELVFSDYKANQENSLLVKALTGKLGENK